ncbi:MAG: DEAD/DEAH box helicase [Candidatus Omnitrophota bacterium]
MVPLSGAFDPAIINGIKIFPDNPFRLEFLIGSGQSELEGDDFREESKKLVRYFLASLTVPDKELWVNLSPYERDRIIPEAFGITEMGRDLLAQDYLLKQVTASLMYPDGSPGKEFWLRVSAKAYEQYGVTDVPVDLFNRVWVLPDRAVVYEQGDTAFVIESRLKVMLDSDYEAMQGSQEPKSPSSKEKDFTWAHGHMGTWELDSGELSKQIVREVILPEIEREVNEGKNFAPLRQIYNSMILATWFKRSLREGLLNKIYVGKNKIEGVDISDKQAKEKIYQRYLEAFQEGVYNLVKEEYDPVLKEIVPKRYTSGGMEFGLRLDQTVKNVTSLSSAQSKDFAMLVKDKGIRKVSVDLERSAKTIPALSYAIYQDAEYINGRIEGGRLFRPGGAKDIFELRVHLDETPLDFSGVVKMILPKDGTLTMFGKGYWQGWEEYRGEPVIIVINNRNVVEVYNSQNQKIFPFGKNIIYPGGTYRNGKVNGTPFNPHGARTKVTIKDYIGENPEFTGVIHRVQLNNHGGLPSMEYLGVKWANMSGYENAFVTIVVEKGRATAIYDASGKQIFPFPHNYVHFGAQYKDGKITGGVLATPHGISSRYELNKLLSAARKKDPGMSCVVEKVPLNDKGGLTYFLGVGKYWADKAGYEKALVTIVVTNGDEITVYDERGKKIFERLRKEENFVYLNARYEEGKIVGGTLLNERGTFDRRELNKIVAPHPGFTGVIDKVRLSFNGGLVKFLGKNVWMGMTEYAYQMVTVVMADGEVTEVYDRSNEPIYPFKENFIYKGARLEKGKIIGGELVNPQGFLDKTFIGKYLNEPENEDFTGVIETRLLFDGGLPVGLEEPGWSLQTEYKHKFVFIVKEKGKTVGIYDEEGTRLFPYDANFVYWNADFIDREIKGGKLLTPAGVRTRKNLNELLAEYPDFTGIITKLPFHDSGRLGQVKDGIYLDYVSAIRGKKVTVKLVKGAVVAIYDERGFMVWSENRESVGFDILNSLWKSGDLQKLLELFGEEGTNRLLFSFFDDLTPKSLIDFFRDYRSFGVRKKFRKKKYEETLKPSEIVKKLGAIGLLQKQSSKADFQEVLRQQLFSLVYSSIVRDYKFIDAIEKEVKRNSFDPVIKNAFEEVIRTYRDLGNFHVEGIRSPTQLRFYQKRGVKFILDAKRVLLSDQSGLGKTLQALTAAVNAYDGKGGKKILIICPDVSIRNTWIKDIQRHLKGEQKIYVVGSKADFNSIKKRNDARDARFIIANYEVLRGEDAAGLRQNIKDLGIDFIIADEGHRIKNNSQLTEAVQEFHAPYQVLISASAQQGRTIAKIFNLLNWLYPERYPDRKEFLRKYGNAEGYWQLKSEMRGFMLRRHKSDVLADMPEINVEFLPVQLKGEQLRLYQEIEKEFDEITESGDYLRMGGVILNLIRVALDTALIRDIFLKDLDAQEIIPVKVGGYYGRVGDVEYRFSFSFKDPVFSYTDSSGKKYSMKVRDGDIVQMGGRTYEIGIKERKSVSAKYEALDRMVDDIVGEKKESMVVFTGARKAVSYLKQRYEKEGYEVVGIDGDVSAKAREDILKKFNTAGRPIILVCTYQTLGESIDITGAHYGVLLDSPWLDREQIMDRLHRLGQLHDVLFTIIVAKDTVDEHVEQVNMESDMIKSIVLDNLNVYNRQKELSKRLILEKVRNKELYSQLRRFQEKVRLIGSDVEKKARSARLLTEYKKGNLSVLYGNHRFAAELENINGETVYLDGLLELVNMVKDLSADSKNALKEFFIQRFKDERQKDVRVKDMILWDICNQIIPGFINIDYDGKLEFMIEWGTYILRRLIVNPDLSKEELMTGLGDEAGDLFNDTMHLLDTSNILKLFSLMTVIPQSYYYEGELLRYEPAISVYYANGRIRYWDQQIVDNIAPGWQISDGEIYSGIEGIEREGRRVRALEESEEKRLANQIRLGNKAAENLLVRAYFRNLKPIAKRVIESGKLEKAFGLKVAGVVDLESLVSAGEEALVDLINVYSEHEIYYNTPLKDFLRKRLNPRMYSLGFQIAEEMSRSVDPEEYYRSELLSEDPVDPGNLEVGEQKKIFAGLLEREGFSDIEAEMIMLFVFEGYSEKELLEEYFQNGLRDPSEQDIRYVENLIASFQHKMNVLGKENLLNILDEGLPVDEDVGGINLDPAILNIETRGSGLEKGFSDIDMTLFDDSSFAGFIPVIIDIAPANLSGFIAN